MSKQHNSNKLTTSVDSFHNFKEKNKRGNKTPASNAININPTHQFMDVITKSSNQNTDYYTEDFPAPKKNTFVYSIEHLLGFWKKHPLPNNIVLNPETTTESNFHPVCKDEGLLLEFREALNGSGKWAALQSPVRSSRPRGRGRSKGGRGRDLYTSTDSARNAKQKEDRPQRTWNTSQSIDALPPPKVVTPVVDPVRVTKPKTAQPIAAVNPSPVAPPNLEVPIKWEYINDMGKKEGPYDTATMQYWHQKGYLPPDLKVKRTKDKDFMVLSQLVTLSTIPFEFDENPVPTASVQSKQTQIPSSSSIRASASPKQKKKVANPFPVPSPVTTPSPAPSSVPSAPSPVMNAPSPIMNAPSSQKEVKKANGSNPFGFASLLGIAPDEVEVKKSDNTFGTWDTSSSKVWSVGNVESQWNTSPQSPVAPQPVIQSSVWKSSSNVPMTLKEIQEQQKKEPKTISIPLSAPQEQDPDTPYWGISSNEKPNLTGLPMHSLFNETTMDTNPWASMPNEVPVVELKQNKKKGKKKQKAQQPAASLWGTPQTTTKTQLSLKEIQEEEARIRKVEHQQMLEEQRRQQSLHTPFGWAAGPSKPTEGMSLQQIQALQIEETRRQQEIMHQKAQAQYSEAQRAMWSNQVVNQPSSGRSLSLREIQEEEIRRKTAEQQKQQQQKQATPTSVNLMWGSGWGAGAPMSFAQIQEQQRSQEKHQNAVTPSAGSSWNDKSTAKPEEQWDDEDSLLWEAQTTPKPAKTSDFPSLGGKPAAKQQGGKGKKQKQKQNSKVGNKNAKANKKPVVSQPSKKEDKEIVVAQPAPAPAPAPSQSAQKGKKKKKMKKLDASQFFSFGSDSLAGRSIEGPEY